MLPNNGCIQTTLPPTRVVSTRVTQPSVAASTGVPRGAKMSTPRCARRPPSRSAPNPLQIALPSTPSTGNASNALACDLDVVAGRRPERRLNAQHVVAALDGVDDDRLRAAARQAHRRRARASPTTLRNKIDEQLARAKLVARDLHGDAPADGHRERIADRRAAGRLLVELLERQLDRIAAAAALGPPRRPNRRPACCAATASARARSRRLDADTAVHTAASRSS